MQPPSVTNHKKSFRLFLTCLALLSMALGCVATSRYGAGVASDSVKYMATAQNLLDGNGLIDHHGSPFLAWPPLYPFLLAGLSLLTRLDVFTAGWYWNIFLAGVNLFLSGMIFQKVFSAKPIYAYLASLFVFLSLSSLRVHDMLGSDPFYLTLTLVFFLAIDVYLKGHSRRAFFWMVLLSALAPMQRFVGLALPVTAGLVLLIEQRKMFRVLLRDGFVLGLFSLAPIFWWLIIHNLIAHGSLWGTSGGQVVDVIQNTTLALTKMLHWFAPYLSFLMPLLSRPVIVLGTLVVILILINVRTRQNLAAWLRALTDSSTYPSMIYAIVYFSAVALTIITADHRYLFSDRYYVILLVPVMLVVFVTLEHLILPHVRLSDKRIAWILTILFVIWSIYPLYSLREYLANALERGEPSEYNLFNTRAYHEMPMVAQMQELRHQQPNAIIYSNYSDAVWFYTRLPAMIPPMRDVPDLQSAYQGWPRDKAGYLVWFKPNEYKHYLSPQELSQFAKLTLIYTDDSGDIYFVETR